MSYRKLTKTEINTLAHQGCKASDWASILVDNEINTENIEYVLFCGQVKIGKGVRLSHIGCLQNYELEEGVCIENTGSLIVEGESTFGNGIKIEILNEGGGRELPIFDTLSSQIAYMLVNYRYDEGFISALEKLIENYVKSKKSDLGLIGENSYISNCGKIKNVMIGPHTKITETIELKDGTIVSNTQAPVQIGSGVIAKEFIIQSGSKISESALLTHCFIGQAVQVGKQFSGENSAFFANSEAFHSEACSIFAGPYTVTHHKSTLLIAGLFSFYNAGSGTNQSNHMYKLGPLHQGILERGAKTGSFSYMLWPSYISAYSAVIGKHYTNFDISEFPFSYLTEEDGKSVLTPAMNLFTVGTKRDSSKWPQRDKRSDSLKHDLIHFDLFNPYIIGRILTGIKKLQELYDSTAREKEYITYKGVYIKRLMLRQAIKFYEIAIKIYIGDELIRQIETIPEVTKFKELKDKIVPGPSTLNEWYDISGMFISSKSKKDILNKVRSGEIASLGSLSNCMQDIFQNYRQESWQWCTALLESRLDKNFSELTGDDFIKIIEDWSANSVKLNNMILNDAGKEFSATSAIGYGIDGDKDDKQKDFLAVRGGLESNSFVVSINKRIKDIKNKGEQLCNRFRE